MKIIVESGATKAAWRSIDGNGRVYEAQSVGMSPYSMDMEAVKTAFRTVIPALNPEGKTVVEVFFYGAGIVSDEAALPLREYFGVWCPFADVHFYSDMLAAAVALFGDGRGIASIMGTGSNSCLYENGRILEMIRSGGHILGDEGGAVNLGKTLLAEFVKGLLPAHLEEEFQKEYNLDYQTIVRKIYMEPAAAAYMASFAPFVTSRLDDPFMRTMAETCLESFVKRVLARYSPENRIGVVGSFGCACEPLLREIGGRYGLEFVKFVKSPIDELVKYHGI